MAKIQFLKTYPLNNGHAPDANQGSRVLRCDVALDAGAAFTIQYNQLLEGQTINNIQTLFVDNSAGANAVLITTSIIGYTLQIPAGRLAFLPFLIGEDGNITVTRADAGTVPLGFINVPLPAIVWAASATPGTQAITAAQLPATLGQKPMATSLAVVIASDQSTVNVRQQSTTPAQSSVAGSTSSQTLVASNANRRGATVFNDSTADLYVTLGAASSTTAFTVRIPGAATPTTAQYYEVPFGYTGAISGVWAVAAGNARMTELT